MTEFEYDCLQEERNNTIIRGRRRVPVCVTLPSDRLAPEELAMRSGPCRTYRLGKPMSMAEFRTMPADLQRLYLRRLRQRGGSESDVEQMLGIKQGSLRRYRVRFDKPNAQAWSAFLRLQHEEE